MTYSEKLQSPQWQKKRLEIFQRDNFSCVRCKANYKQLQVHHKKYIKGNDPWNYENHFLETLCITCHKNEHEIIIDPDRKYEHLLIQKEDPEVITNIYVQIAQLNNKLRERPSDDLETEILGNIVFLQKKLKEFGYSK